MRIVSLLPSATEIVYALDLGHQLVAVTHECDFPLEARTKPVLTRGLLPAGLPSVIIDRAVLESRRDAHSIYELDVERLIALEPDVVLTQSLCDVCAVPRSAVDDAVCNMPNTATVVSLDPHSLSEVLENIEDVSEVLGVPERGQRLVLSLQQRINAVQEIVSRTMARPRVFCCEWLDPIYCSGHWVPDQVRLAGGEDSLGRHGEPAAAVAWDEVVRSGTEVLLLMPCGFDATQAAARLVELSGRPGWDTLPATRAGQVFAVDGSAYFSRPGPRLVDGVDLLARIVHPEAFVKPTPEGAVLKLVPSAEGGHFEAYH